MKCTACGSETDLIESELIGGGRYREHACLTGCGIFSSVQGIEEDAPSFVEWIKRRRGRQHGSSGDDFAKSYRGRVRLKPAGAQFYDGLNYHKRDSMGRLFIWRPVNREWRLVVGGKLTKGSKPMHGAAA